MIVSSHQGPPVSASLQKFSFPWPEMRYLSKAAAKSPPKAPLEDSPALLLWESPFVPIGRIIS